MIEPDMVRRSLHGHRVGARRATHQRIVFRIERAVADPKADDLEVADDHVLRFSDLEVTVDFCSAAANDRLVGADRRDHVLEHAGYVNHGWSVAYIVFAAITGGLAIPVALLVVRTQPADVGLLPDGKEALVTTGLTEAGTPATEGLTLKGALATQAFWLLAAAILLLHSHMGVMQNQIPHLEDLGFSAGIVASAMSIVAVMSALGTLIFGWLCDKIPVKGASVVSQVLVVLSIVLLIYINESSPPWLIWTYTTILGLGIGGGMPTMSILTSTNFGLIAYGTIYGTLSIFQSTGAAVGPILAGYTYDTRNTYHWAFIIIAILVGLSIPLILAIRRPKALSGSDR